MFSLRLAAYLLIAPTLMGMFVVALLVADMISGTYIIGAAVAGAVVGLPAAWWLAAKLNHLLDGKGTKRAGRA